MTNGLYFQFADVNMIKRKCSHNNQKVNGLAENKKV